MSKVYVMRFDSHHHNHDIEICQSRDLAIKCAKERLKRYEVKEIKMMDVGGVTCIWGRDTWYSYMVEIEEKELLTSVDDFLSSRFEYLRSKDNASNI